MRSLVGGVQTLPDGEGKGMKTWSCVVLAALLLLICVQSAHAVTIATNVITVTDGFSGGTVTIVSAVEDNFLGDFTKLEFSYTVTNVSFDPTPGTSNYLSGFQSVFVGAVAGFADQYGPASWFFNCCGTIPPFGAEWDINNSTGFGVPIGGTDVFGYSVPAGHVWTDAFTGSWMHSWEFDQQVYVFNLADNTSGLSILTPIVPEPGTGVLLGMALVGLAWLRRRR